MSDSQRYPLTQSEDNAVSYPGKRLILITFPLLLKEGLHITCIFTKVKFSGTPLTNTAACYTI